MLSIASAGGGIGPARASTSPVGSGGGARRSRRIATSSTTNRPARPNRADEAELLTALAPRRCVLGALRSARRRVPGSGGARPGARVATIFRPSNSVSDGLRRTTALSWPCDRHVHEGGREVERSDEPDRGDRDRRRTRHASPAAGDEVDHGQHHEEEHGERARSRRRIDAIATHASSQSHPDLSNRRTRQPGSSPGSPSSASPATRSAVNGGRTDATRSTRYVGESARPSTTTRRGAERRARSGTEGRCRAARSPRRRRERRRAAGGARAASSPRPRRT